MSLTGKQSEELHKAILVAFPSKGDLARIVKHKLGQNLEEIATDGNLSTVVFTLIVWLESRNLVENFVVGAREDNPGNEDLRIFADNYHSDLGISNPRFADSETFEAAFERETRRARRQIKRTIPGLKTPVPRIEIEWLEEQLCNSIPVLFTGDAGTGKSAVADELADNADREGKAVLFIDSRRIAYVQNDAQLQQHLGVAVNPIKAIEDVVRRKRCRLIIEQLDNSIGSDASRVLVDLAIDCCRIDGIEIVVVSRKREANEVALLQQLSNEGFKEHTSYPLGLRDAELVLERLGINNRPPELVELARNLLNLELIGRIKLDHPSYDFSQLTQEVELWERYIESITQSERVLAKPEAARQVIAEAMRLARLGLNRADRTFLLDYDISQQQGRLISAMIILPDRERRYRFRHEKLQDYLYARDAFERTLTPIEVGTEIDQFRTANIIQWMDKLYKRSGTHDARRRFLEQGLYV